MNIGMTGTRHGATPAQQKSFRHWLEQNERPEEYHFGACVGADAECFRIARAVWGDLVVTVAHPSDIPALTDPQALEFATRVMDPLPPLVRNRNIVQEADILLALPDGPEIMRSGTWSTVRLGRRLDVPVVVFWPDGAIEFGREEAEVVR